MATAATPPQTVPPVFVLDKSLPGSDIKEYTVVELCTAAEKVAGFGKVVGSQRIHNLHRIYFKDIDARTAVLVNGLVLRGTLVKVRDQNPNVVINSDGTETEVRAVRLMIGNVPLSVSNVDILEHVKNLPSVKTRSRLMDERARDDNNKLTTWLTGRRFIYIDAPPQPLPKTLKIGVFTASLYHPGQKIIKCSKCLETGHHVSACRSEIRCRQCLSFGHRQGSELCEFTPPSEENSQATPPTERPKSNETSNSEESSPPLRQERATEENSVQLPDIRKSVRERARRSRSASGPKRPRSHSPTSLSPPGIANKRKPADCEREDEMEETNPGDEEKDT